MIDTIILMLPSHMFHVSKPELFSPSAAWAQAPSTKARRASKQNPTKKELLSGIYKPRLTLSSRINHYGTQEITLKIELSLPKLMFGNNFSELRYKDFKPLMQKLVELLNSMGVEITSDAVAQAPVFVIHYAKNIVLTDGSTPYHYINKIKEANVKLFLDVNQTEYRNEGHCYRWHCNSYEVVFYDKIRELEHARKRSKRTIEKDGALQFELLKRLQKRRKKFEVLRMEVRLTKRQKIKQLFEKLGIASDLTFKKLCKPAISKKILLHYIDELESRRPLLLNYRPTSDKALLAELIFNNRALNARQIMQAYGLKKAMEELGLRELRLLLSHCSKNSWYKLMADAQKIKLPNVQNPLMNMRAEIEKFKALSLEKI